ncbi:MAG: UDP-N-acetylmuramoyl-L-alanine--D-glutamate ligase, partial [Nocardioides sp.]
MSPRAAVEGLARHDDWSGLRVVVAGFGVSGQAAADNLLHLGAQVQVVDEAPPTPGSARAERATLLRLVGGAIDLAPGATAALADDVDLVVTSP